MDRGFDARPVSSLDPSTSDPGADSTAAESTNPLSAPSRLLPFACLEWLADGNFVNPKPGSPLEFLRGARRLASGRERQRAGARLLSLDPWTHKPLLAQRLRFSPLGQALAILEAPEARLRLALAVPGRLTAVVQYYVRGRLAVAAEVDPEGLRVSAPVRLADLRQSVAAELDNSSLPPAMEAVAVLPEVFELLNALWGPGGRAVSEPITLEDLLERLDGSRQARQQATQLLAAMVDAELLVRREEAYFLVDRLAAWLARVWSGHVLEMECQPLDASRETEEESWLEEDGPVAGRERLIFVGPPGERILCEDLVTGIKQSVMLLSRLAGWELGDRLRRFFGGVTRGMRSLLESRDSELAQGWDFGGVLPVH